LCVKQDLFGASRASIYRPCCYSFVCKQSFRQSRVWSKTWSVGGYLHWTQRNYILPPFTSTYTRKFTNCHLSQLCWIHHEPNPFTSFLQSSSHPLVHPEFNPVHRFFTKTLIRSSSRLWSPRKFLRQFIQPAVLLPIVNSSTNLTIYQFLYEHIHPFIYKSNQTTPHTSIGSLTTEAISPSHPSVHWLNIHTHVHFMFDNNP